MGRFVFSRVEICLGRFRGYNVDSARILGGVERRVRYRFELFKIAHNATDPYPVQVSCVGLFGAIKDNNVLINFLKTNTEQDTPFTVTDPQDNQFDRITDAILLVASSQDDFMFVLEKILASPRTERTLHSLIARTNDMGLEPVGR
jgi:hypothetical protein